MEFKRKLTTILSADAVGYSRLMADNEEETVRTLKLYRSIIESLITKYTGRLVDSPGDNILAEFSSVVDSLRCAWDIQQEIKSRNLDLPENRRMRFRIGVNLGDVIEEEGRIYGDGVNVAARLESLADAGGICISGNVYNHVKNKLSFRYGNQGNQTVKNIEDPVHVYRVLMEPERVQKEPVKQTNQSKWKRVLAVALGVLILSLAGVGFYIWGTYIQTPEVGSLVDQKDEITLPAESSIAVLPFDNMSGNKDKEYICEGMSENIITALSNATGMTVVSRQSSFKYKDKRTDVKEISEDLKVRYVLEGSIQSFGENIRVTAQLIDATKGHHLWAESYDRKLKDLFAIQDEITLKIVKALQVELTEKNLARLVGKGSDNFEAYLTFYKARKYVMAWNKSNIIISRNLLRKAIALDPEWAVPYGILGLTYVQELFTVWCENDNEVIKQALYLADKSQSLDSSIPAPYLIRSHVLLYQRQYDKAIFQCEKALGLHPNTPVPYFYLGWIYIFMGEPEKAIDLYNKGGSTVPKNPIPSYTYYGLAYRDSGQYEKAIVEFQKECERNPDNHTTLVHLASTYCLAGKYGQAQEIAKEIKIIDPNFSIQLFKKALSYKDQTHTDRIIDALRKAGLK